MVKDRIPYGIVNKRELKKAKDEAIDNWLEESSRTLSALNILRNKAKSTKDGMLIDNFWYDTILKYLEESHSYDDELAKALVEIQWNL